MTSSDVVIRARDLRKVYRLYKRPGYRLMDMLGLLPSDGGGYREHAALEGVTFEVRSGEKIAIIGRNGAGKSTLLKLVTQAIVPTSGVLEVRGETQALLQIGTGFHPDLTGRENALAYLAHVGVSERDAHGRIGDIVEFAELEEYIDQPLKTYSSGMAMRLMFATATVIAPSLLVIDEVLGVGDAYFARKSFDRIQSLCDRESTTLILVSHDIYNASRLCDRMIWLDRGRVLIDSAPAEVVKAYEDSIRAQEEERLRLKRLSAIRKTVTEATSSVLVEIRSRNSRPQPCPVYFSQIGLWRHQREVASLPIAGQAAAAGSRLELDAGCWGAPVTWHGATSRPMLNYGSPFHKAAGVLIVQRPLAADGTYPLTLRLRYWMDRPCDLAVYWYGDHGEAELGALPATSGVWTTHELDCAAISSERQTLPSVNTSGSHGAGDVAIHGARFLNERGCERDVLEHGRPARLEVEYEIVNPTLSGDVQVVVALQREDAQDVCRFVGRRVSLNSRARRGTLALDIPSFDLTDGTYAVTILIARAGYYDSPQTMFYTTNPDMYCCLSRFFDVAVRGSGSVGAGTVSVREGLWSVR